MKTYYVKVTTAGIAPPCDVSIYSAVQTHATPEASIKALQRAADRRNIKATYELSDYATYASHRAMLRSVASVSKHIESDTANQSKA